MAVGVTLKLAFYCCAQVIAFVFVKSCADVCACIYVHSCMYRYMPTYVCIYVSTRECVYTNVRTLLVGHAEM